MIRGSLGSLPDPGKAPLFVWIAQNLRHSWVLSANGAKFAQFASNLFLLLWLQKTDLKQTVEFKIE